MFQARRLWTLMFALAVVAPTRAADADSFVPADTTMLVTVNVRQILDSALVKKHALEHIKEVLKGNAQAQQVLTAVGLDPLKDFTSVTVAANEKVTDGHALVIVNGNFDVAKIENVVADFAKNNSDKVKVLPKEGGLQIYEGKGDDGKPVFAAFPNKDTLLISPQKALLTDGKKKSELKKELRALSSKVDSKQSVSLMALIPEEGKKALAGNPQTANIGPKLESITGNVNITDGVTIDLAIHTSDAKAAEELRRLVDALKGFLVLAAQNNEQAGKLVSDFVDNLKTGTDQTTVTISGKLTEEQISKVLKK
jgi:hypothetical protein